MVTAPVVDLESSPTEVRLRVGRVACSPRLARAATELVRQWLGQPTRFPLDCVVDVGELSWLAATASPAPGKDGIGRFPGLRIECVAAEGGRAVRLSGGGSADGAARTDELRVLTTTTAATAAGPPALRLEVAGAVATPVPVAILEACLGCDAGALSCGADAVVSGRIDSTCEGSGSTSQPRPPGCPTGCRAKPRWGSRGLTGPEAGSPSATAGSWRPEVWWSSRCSMRS
jgi:hypothetical protein